MTQEEQERDLVDAQTYLSCTTLTVDRCRHESVDRASLWVFDHPKDRHGKTLPRQIGSISRLPGEPASDYRWDCTHMYRGQPVARRSFRTLLECIGDIMAYNPRA